jgi:phospholipid/cholesterol/gamma-HCH transport system substrate-binding protein
MPQKTHDELKAGLFILTVLALLVGLILWLGVAGLFTTKGQEVAFYLPDTSPGAGIEKGSAVVIAGQKIGMINSVNFDPENQRTMYVAQLTDKNLHVYADGTAQAASSLVGGTQVAITSRGTDTSPLADANNPILVTGGIQQAINDMALTLEILRVTMDRELNPEDTDSLISEIHGITSNLETSTEDLTFITAAIRKEVKRDDPAALLAKTHVILSQLQILAPKLNTATDDLGVALAGTVVMINKINSGEGSLGMMLNDPRLYKSLLGSGEQMELLLEEIRGSLDEWKASGIPMKLK